ncbi:MAG: molybdopterin-binding protein [Chloroflexota bacterium]
MKVPGNGSPRVELISIGSELLLGETVDTNAAFLGAELAAIGLPVSGARMLPDDLAVIRDAFADAMARCRLVVATGGLGPTHDDLTREGLADALGETLAEDPTLIEALEARFLAYGRMPAANRRQAMLIPDAQPLENPIGSAPGWWVERDGRVVVLLPGVPSEMRLMWTERARPRLEARFAATPLEIRTVKAFGIGESAMAERLGPLIEAPPDGVSVGIYARDDGVHVRFSTRGEGSALEGSVSGSLALLGDDAYGTDDADLATAALVAIGGLGAETVASWESDTGGALLAILSAAQAAGPAARYVGGILDAGGASGPPMADAVLQVSLLPQDANGRSRVRVALAGSVALPATEVRIHGSGPQRQRRAAYAALDVVRRLSSSGR